MENKQYEFYGIDFKTELLLGLITGLICILLWFGLLFLYYEYLHLDSILRISKRIFFICMFIGLFISMVLLRTMGILFRNMWRISDSNNQFVISYKNHTWKIDKKDIQKINYIGNNSFRYLSFFTNNDKIKIRVGHNILTPFSKKKDIEIIEKFIEYISPFLQQHFNHQNKKIVFFENQGVYDRKK